MRHTLAISCIQHFVLTIITVLSKQNHHTVKNFCELGLCVASGDIHLHS